MGVDHLQLGRRGQREVTPAPAGGTGSIWTALGRVTRPSSGDGASDTGARAAVFLDRDGVLDELVPDPQTGRPESPLHWRDVRLLPGAAAAVRELREGGYAVACVTNQPAAAKGYAPVEELEAVHGRVVQLLAAEGAHLDGWRMCLHHPEATVPPLAGPCDCRKPAPGMLLELATELGLDLRRSWAIGDSDVDVLAGAGAGCRTVLVEHPDSAHRRTGAAHPDARVRSLLQAVKTVLNAPAVAR